MSSNKDYDKERYYWYKSKGICPGCGQEKAAEGHAYCLSCLDRQAVCQMVHRSKLTPEQREKNKKRDAVLRKQQYEERKKAGICVTCGKRKAKEGILRCKMCAAKTNYAQYQRAIQKPKKHKKMDWIASGLCMLCGEECAPGYKLCERHLMLAKENGKKGFEARWKWKGGNW